MPGIARQTDMCIGICTAHSPSQAETGFIQQGSSDVRANSLGVARMADIVRGQDSTGFIIQGSSKVRANSIGIARIADRFQGVYSGTIIMGSSDVFTV